MGPLLRIWRELRARARTGPSPAVGIAIVVAATGVVLAVGWALSALIALVY